MSYKTLSIIQAIFIILTALSLFDTGFVASGEDGILVNELLFEDDGLIGGILNDAIPEFWSAFQFWAYCFMIVAILQLLKATSVDL